MSNFGVIEMEKCTSWMGHNFKARYDFGEPDLNKIRSTFKSFKTDDMGVFFESLKPKTYVHDVCTRCGTTVERPK